jgi:hypothetical protein
MNLDWYLFEHSYLMDIKTTPLNGTLLLTIDAKMTYDHARINKHAMSKGGFIEIEIAFKGVRYLELLNSPNLLKNPNEDIGSIELFNIKDYDHNLSEIQVEISLRNKKLKCLTFVSEMISANLVFEEFSIKEK